MPTGIEETLGAVAAFIAANVALSPFAGTADPNGSIEAAEGARFVPSAILEVSVQEGTSSTAAVAEPPIDGAGGSNFASQAPVDGDHPPAGTVYERPAILEGQAATEYVFTDELVIDVGKAAAPDSAAADDAGASEASVAPPAGEAESPEAPLQPPAWTPPPTGLVDMTPPAVPAVDGTSGGGIGVPADWADAWERSHEYSWSKLLFDRSGEQLTRDAKHAVEEALGEWLDSSYDDPDASEAGRIARAAVAGAAQSLFDVGFGLLVVPVLDPSSVARGIMRTGVASAVGIEDIKQGRTLEGAMKITGEVSAVVLTVAAPVRAVVAKGPPPKPGEASMTVFLEQGGKGIESVTGAHNTVRVTVPKSGGKPARDVFTEVGRELSPKLEVVAGAKTKPFDAAKLAERTDLRGGQITSFTRPLSPDAARRAASFADRAANMTYKDAPGGIAEFSGTPKDMAARLFDTGMGRAGPFSTIGEQCATYAAAVARAGGIPAAGRFGPHIMYLMFKYGGPPGQGLVATGAAVGMMGNAGAGPAAPPGG